MQKTRSEVLARLRALSSHEISDRSSRAVARLLASPFFPEKDRLSARKTGIYRSLPGEVQLSGLESELRDRGTILCYPRIVDSAACVMRFVQVDDPTHPESWEPGPYGGMEPRSGFPEVAAEELDLIVVPGIAFGRAGERIGRGKGYYDRFLPLATRALRLAACFDFQLFPALRQSPWDQPVHCVFTETEQVVTAGARAWLETA